MRIPLPQAFRLGLALLLVVTGCAREAGEPAPALPRLVLLYAPCTVSTRYLQPYRAEVDFTPALERFARRSLVFERHQTEAAMSGIAYASIFTGSTVSGHGVYRHPTRLPDDLTLIGEVFARAGYDTHAWLAHPMASQKLGYSQGVARENVRGRVLRGGGKDLGAVLDQLVADPSYRLFLLVNFTVTHAPYEATPGFCETYGHHCPRDLQRRSFEEWVAFYDLHFGRLSMDFEHTLEVLALDDVDRAELESVIDALYRGRVRVLDELFDSVLRELKKRKLMRSSLIALTADHGEVFPQEGRHFPWTHGYELVPEELHVPLVLFGPTAGVKPGRFAGVTRSIDVLPTLAALSGIELDEDELEGVDLSAGIRGEEPASGLVARSHSGFYSDAFWEQFGHYERIARRLPSELWVAARQGDEFHRVVVDPEGEVERQVFDLVRDPGATENVYRDEPAQRELAQRLEAWRDRVSAEAAIALEQPAGLDEDEIRKRLQQLGYIGYAPLD